MLAWLRRSLTRRLAAAFAAVGVLAAGLAAASVNLAFETRFAGYLDEQQQLREQRLLDGLAASHARHGGWDPADVASTARGVLHGGGELTLTDADGAEVWDSAAEPGWHQQGGHGQQRRSDDERRGDHNRRPEHHDQDRVALGELRTHDVVVDGETVGSAEIALPHGGALPADQELRQDVNRLVALGGVAAAVLALLAGGVIARRVAAPAERLTAAAHALPDDRTARVPEDRTDELGDMARAFNRMAEQVAAQEALRRDFAADVAHELRTPLTVLRGRLEALADGVADPDPDVLTDLHEEALALSQRVTDLERLARADAAEFSLERQPVDLAGLVADVAAGARERLGERLVLAAPTGEAIVHGDPDRLRQVVTNLLANAERHAPEATVRVSVASDADAVTLVVVDDGPGIPTQDQARVFDRFVRGPGGGSGVGLTIVRDLVAAHGGQVTLDSAPGSGTTVTVTLPRGAVG